MLPPTVFGYDSNILGLHGSANSSMYLGEWRSHISNKINPRYFNQLENFKFAISAPNYLSKSNYINSSRSFLVPVFSDSLFSSVANDNDIYFSFVSESIKMTPFALSQLISSYVPSSQFGKSKGRAKLIEQEYYTPGYIFSSGSRSYGVGAVLLQQRFLDDSFGLATFASSSSYQPYSDRTFINTNRGTGYQLNFTQRLPASIDVSVDYRSKVQMNEFDTLGKSYSDPGDFDIPSQYTVSLGMAFFNASRINFSAEKISYNNISPIVHSGYSQSFLNVFNSPITPVFKLEDLTVYSISFEQNINDVFSWNIDVTSRQQASATARIFDRILKNDTASVSYKIGISQSTSFGHFNLFASFANKPILIGGTDFGRLSSTSLNSHIEGVASWSYRF